MSHPLPLPEDDAPIGLSSSHCLDDVEALMLHAVVGRRLDRVGVIAQEHLSAGGRRLRARLALAATEALGRTRELAVPWAAACELLHNATLLHDDVQDGDRARRGHPAAWARHGIPQAINTGDLLIVLPTAILAELDAGDDVKWALSRALALAAERTVRGQAFELDLRPARRVDFDSWARAAEGKSGALLALPVEGAARLAGLAPATAERVSAEFARLGVLYQLYDDVLDLYGDKGREQPGNDLREGKVSALVVEHLRLHPSETDAVFALLDTPREEVRDADVEVMISRFRSGGALASARRRADALRASILDASILGAVPDLRALAAELVSGLAARAGAA